MTEPNPTSGQTPAEMLGVLFAPCGLGHLDQDAIRRYEERIQAEATRIRAASR